ncbi:MAG: MBL fold metallo-hydrolase [Candidatus Colwellbacteria bacterium]|nr:MBL fold metallo-hydrolase [Candidatus Colwellbacteria bacterium]
MTLKFEGGARTVTGSNYLLSQDETKILVDCGLHQGSNFCERHNFEPFPFNPREIKAVFVTHAHIDHTGLLPKLYKDGFRGRVYSTPPTKDFARELLLDSRDILRREAEREGQSELYSVKDVEGIMSLWETVDYYKPVNVHGFKVTLKNSGHILGSAFMVFEGFGKKIVFSGDLGNYSPPLIKESDPLEPVQYCLIESAYGDRIHLEGGKGPDLLEDVIEEAVLSQGTLLIPVFAMERTQQLLFAINELIEKGKIPRVPMFLDSPLAIKLTAVYKWHEGYFNSEAKKLIAAGDSLFSFPGLTTTLTTEESKAINNVPSPKVIMAGAGMSHGGRIVHHERRYLSDPASTILFMGYQVEGSLGRRIQDGAQSVKIFGEEVPVKCRVRSISSYSAHADQKKLLNWLSPARKSLKEVFVVQGEVVPSEILATRIRDEFAVQAIVPSLGDEVVL